MQYTPNVRDCQASAKSRQRRGYRQSRAERVILTIPFEDTTATAPRHTVGILTEPLSEALTEALNYVGAEVVATVLAAGAHRRGEVCERADRMAQARNAGHDAVQG